MIAHYICQAARITLLPVPWALFACGQQPVKLYPSACSYGLFFQGDSGTPPSRGKKHIYLGDPKAILFTAVYWELHLLGSSKERTNCSQDDCKRGAN